MNIGRFNIGIHPINWVGEDVFEHGDHYTADDVLSQISELGLAGVEMSRKFPTDPSLLTPLLEKYRLQLVSQWKSVLFSDPEYREKELASYREHAIFLKKMGCKVISTAEIGGSLHWDPRRTPNEKQVNPLDTRGWVSLAHGLNEAGEICKALGMKLVYHHHGGTVVEKANEIDRLMDLTDPELVYLLFDTGHAYYGGNDPLTLLKKHINRVGYVHLKDIRINVLKQARLEGWDFVTCIRNGVFTVPGDGGLEFEEIFRTLIDHDYSGWAMIEGEQDPAINDPFKLAQSAMGYITKLIY
ncbi:myo-inosose-2 dehydratase [Paenibacillus alginolyticus]|uniref:myo-inosose-2 dehydratase n=1 Tax=Paenibacillus alginolyticus TaxID=59839 RepID=UPI000413A677|nr:myo-inosose-2 dehydratase [Paenibacillus alginolyticus]MCY9665789.1 myo-inosose-2 dehydratase [Paenibacillus alginolyticus]